MIIAIDSLINWYAEYIGVPDEATASRTDATSIPVFAESDFGTDAWSIENARPSNDDE
jgi:hypothetical protein